MKIRVIVVCCSLKSCLFKCVFLCSEKELVETADGSKLYTFQILKSIIILFIGALRSAAVVSSLDLNICKTKLSILEMGFGTGLNAFLIVWKMKIA